MKEKKVLFNMPHVYDQVIHENNPDSIVISSRNCANCNRIIANYVLFCPICGTKNYVKQKIKNRSGKLLVLMENCVVTMMQISRMPGVFCIYDNRIFFKTEYPKNDILIGFTDLKSIEAYYTDASNFYIKLICQSETTLTLSLSCIDVDYFHYITNLLFDYMLEKND